MQQVTINIAIINITKLMFFSIVENTGIEFVDDILQNFPYGK